MKKLAVVSAILMFPVLALAGIDDIFPTETWIMELMKFISTAKGLGTLAFAAGLTQLVMLLFQTPMAEMAGKWRLVIVSALSVIGVVLGALVTGMPIGQALLSGPALAALQVFINQVYKQFFDKP